MPAFHSIVIVEDEPETLKRFVRLVDESGSFECVAACENFKKAAMALEKYQPEILLLDIDLPDGNGLDLIRFVEQNKFDTKSVVVTVFEDSRHVEEALVNGAIGYILKDDSLISIEQALLMILNNGAPISPAIARRVLLKFKENHQGTIDTKEKVPQVSLSSREKEILQYVSDGFTDKEIAKHFNVSYHTVTTHVKNIYRKLSVGTRVEATREALKQGFVYDD